MIQSKKLFVIFAGIALLTLGAAVVFSAGDKNIDTLRSSATNSTPVSGSVTFDRSTVTDSLGKGTFVFESSTSINGNKIYLKSSNNTNYSLGKTMIAYFDSSNTDNNLQFYKDPDATQPFSFQNIQSVSFNSGSSGSTPSAIVLTQSTDGVTYNTNSTLNPANVSISSNSINTTNNVKNARYLKISCGGGWAQILSLTINFKCSDTFEENRFYTTTNVLQCLDFNENRYYKFNVKNTTVYWISFSIDYREEGTKFTLTYTGTNASSTSTFGYCPFEALEDGEKNTTGKIENGIIKLSLYYYGSPTEYTFVKIS